MEEKAAIDVSGASNARPASTAGSFANRRQKNLEKFRKQHKAAHRHVPVECPSEAKQESAVVADEKSRIGTVDTVRKTASKEINTPALSPTRKDANQAEEGQAAPMSPQCTPKRRAHIIKKLSKHYRHASPKRDSATTTKQGQDLPTVASLSMEDTSNNNTRQLSRKCESRQPAEVLDRKHFEAEQSDENIPMEQVHERVSSKPAEEALKPKTNNRQQRGRRAFHHKKKAKDLRNHRDGKANSDDSKKPASTPNSDDDPQKPIPNSDDDPQKSATTPKEADKVADETNNKNSATDLAANTGKDTESSASNNLEVNNVSEIAVEQDAATTSVEVCSTSEVEQDAAAEADSSTNPVEEVEGEAHEVKAGDSLRGEALESDQANQVLDEAASPQAQEIIGYFPSEMNDKKKSEGEITTTDEDVESAAATTRKELSDPSPKETEEANQEIHEEHLAIGLVPAGEDKVETTTTSPDPLFVEPEGANHEVPREQPITEVTQAPSSYSSLPAEKDKAETNSSSPDPLPMEPEGANHEESMEQPITEVTQAPSSYSSLPAEKDKAETNTSSPDPLPMEQEEANHEVPTEQPITEVSQAPYFSGSVPAGLDKAETITCSPHPSPTEREDAKHEKQKDLLITEVAQAPSVSAPVGNTNDETNSGSPDPLPIETQEATHEKQKDLLTIEVTEAPSTTISVPACEVNAEANADSPGSHEGLNIVALFTEEEVEAPPPPDEAAGNITPLFSPTSQAGNFFGDEDEDEADSNSPGLVNEDSAKDSTAEEDATSCKDIQEKSNTPDLTVHDFLPEDEKEARTPVSASQKGAEDGPAEGVTTSHKDIQDKAKTPSSANQMDVEDDTAGEGEVKTPASTSQKETEDCTAAEEETPSHRDIQEKSTSFDIRSIHDFPPECIKDADAVPASQDPTWDAAKDFFTEFQHPDSSKSRSEPLNLFDTPDASPWTANTAFSFGATFEMPDDVFATDIFSEVAEEKKDSESPRPLSLDTNTQTMTMEAKDSPESNASPRRRMSRAKVNDREKSFDDIDVTNLAVDELEPKRIQDSKPTCEDDDNQNLLGDKLDDSDEEGWKAGVTTPKSERIQSYTAPLDDDDNSSKASSVEELDDASKGSEEPIAVEYVAQAEGEEDDDESISRVMDDCEASMEIVEDAPQMALSAEAAASADQIEDKSETVSEHGPVNENGESVDHVGYISKSNSSSSFSGLTSSTGLTVSTGFNSAAGSSKTTDIPAVGESSQQIPVTDDDSSSHEASEDSTADESDKEKPSSSSSKIEESGSLVGISLVPSFEGKASTSNHPGPSKIREGMPPRGDVSPSILPPPPPPPLSKKKRKKKKKKGSSKGTPLLSAPPMEKFKQWQESKERGVSMRLGVVKEASMETDDGSIGRRPKVDNMVCTTALPEAESWEMPSESPGRINLACGNFAEDGPWAAALKSKPQQADLNCGDFGDLAGTTSSLLDATSQQACGLSDAFAMAGIDSLTSKSQGARTGASPSPMEAARAMALGGLTDAFGMTGMDGTSSKAPPRTETGASPSPMKAARAMALGGLTDAFGMTGMDATSSKAPPKTQPGPSPSPVDAARCIALENAMKRANKDFGSSVRTSQVETKSLFENEVVPSASTGSSVNMEAERPSLNEVETLNGRSDRSNCWRKPSARETKRPEGIVFLHELTSPSLSISPSSGAQHVNASKQSGAMSPLIHDSKMAEKAALASYAAAVTFEEKYASALSKEAGIEADEESVVENSNPDEIPESGLPSLFCAPELGENLKKMATGEDGKPSFGKDFVEIAEMLDSQTGILKGFVSTSPARETKSEVHDLRGGAFSPWRNAMYANGETKKGGGSVSHSLSLPESESDISSVTKRSNSSLNDLRNMHKWLTTVVLEMESQKRSSNSDEGIVDEITTLLEDDDNLSKLCTFVVDRVNAKIDIENEERASSINGPLSPRKKLRPFNQTGRISGRSSASVVAANFVSFIHRISRASGVANPFGDDNPFLLDLVGSSLTGGNSPLPAIEMSDGSTMQKIVFSRCTADNVVKFCIEVCGGLESFESNSIDVAASGDSSFDPIESCRAANPSPTKKSQDNFFGRTTSKRPGDRRLIFPNGRSSPFESAVKQNSKILSTILSFLGDPVAVCRIKMTNRTCRDFVTNNEQVLMRDAVRLGGLSMNVRPSFWLWVTLEKCGRDEKPAAQGKSRERLIELEECGRTGKWHNVIQRDVARSFGNMPPHKTGARLRTDSIVRALVTWGHNRIMKRGVKGGGNPPPHGSHASFGDSTASDASQAPTDTVSDWGGVSPVASFTGSCNGIGAVDGEERKSSRQVKRQDSQSVSADMLVLSGNALSEDMKADLQGKLGFILHSLAAAHDDVGYCQGMDYVVAHLLRILQDTVYWRAATGTLPASVQVTEMDGDSTSKNSGDDKGNHKLIVEDTVFQVMDCLFTNYNLQHMYWPELRCLKTCCKVFERLIQLKLPVLADHFEHHELNVGLFALGWFQTLFLYLPSMPSATVCHMWDIWLVERSFKIFFRVGTAILFLSQPILLNHETEGMMTYLNTFPDATLLNPDILIACALQIKVTNKMLMDIELEVCKTD